jgi:2-polyprenyl-3-methyl-5-hydroxy-6-metoxy-1,4-benzoquinol methylase
MDYEGYRDFPCDVCGGTDAVEIECSRRYTNNEPIHVCKNCGFVYVVRRRSARAIADSWSRDIYQVGYTARIPAVKARQTYVADMLDVELGLGGKTLCDIGGGEGQFLEIARDQYGAKVFAVEPSAANCAGLAKAGIPHFHGTVEDFSASAEQSAGPFDVVTIMWTLENCQQPRVMLDAAWTVVKPGGHIAVATGSRILAPFKKPLHYYMSKQVADAHATRYSANTLQAILAVSGFRPVSVNRWVDTDYLVVIAARAERGQAIPWRGDDPAAVLDFFRRWDIETQAHYRDA